VESEARAADDDNSGDGRSSKAERQVVIGCRLRERRMGKTRQNDSCAVILSAYRLDIADREIRCRSCDRKWSVACLRKADSVGC
jgi:hypothetical protein